MSYKSKSNKRWDNFLVNFFSYWCPRKQLTELLENKMLPTYNKEKIKIMVDLLLPKFVEYYDKIIWLQVACTLPSFATITSYIYDLNVNSLRYGKHPHIRKSGSGWKLDKKAPRRSKSAWKKKKKKKIFFKKKKKNPPKKQTKKKKKKTCCCTKRKRMPRNNEAIK